MILLAIKGLLHRPGRSLLVVLAVAAILAEILVLEGFLAGINAQSRNAVLDRGGDVVVLQEGVQNFLATRSVLRQQARAEVEALDGVAATHPLALISLIFEQDQRRTPIIVFAYDDAGGPKALAAGKPPLGEREIVIDASIARRFGLRIGDTFRVSDYDFTVSGMTEGAAAIMTPFAFVTFDNLIDFYFNSDVAADIAAFPLLSYLLVDVVPGTSPDDVAGIIAERVPDTSAMLPAEVARNDENLTQELFGPILNLLLGLSYGAGALAIGLFLYAAVRTRHRVLGVLRALGFTLRHLIASVLFEAVFLTVLAIPVGMLMAVGLGRLIERLDPVFLLPVTEPAALARTAIAAIALAGAGALVPLRSLMRLDPATAFRG